MWRQTRRVLRAAYVDMDGTLLGRGGSVFHDADGAFTTLGVRALEACARAEVEVVPYSGRRRSTLLHDARLLGLRSYIFEAGVGLVLDGEVHWVAEEVDDGPANAVARHMRARGYAPEECIAVGDSPEDLGAAKVVGTFWLVANAMPEVHDAARAIANARIAEASHGAGVYEAVITELAERR
jgi:hydroxymethylpyrimidine pyrophosphatase-like HAD family hydrolase